MGIVVSLELTCNGVVICMHAWNNRRELRVQLFMHIHFNMHAALKL